MDVDAFALMTPEKYNHGEDFLCVARIHVKNVHAVKLFSDIHFHLVVPCIFLDDEMEVSMNVLNHLGTQMIETERLILRRYQISDAENMFNNWVTDAEVTRFWGWLPHKDIEETKTLLAGWINEYDSPTTYHWVIVLKENKQAIGYVYLNAMNETDRSSAIHYLISRKYWNRGIATEACKAIIGYAFSKIGIKSINSCHHIDNPASGKVMQKSGMKFAKEAYRQFPAGDERMNGIYRYYTLNAEDWSGIQQAPYFQNYT